MYFNLETPHIQEKQSELISKMFAPEITAHLKNGSIISGRYAGLSAHNNAPVALKTGNWEVYSEGKICDQDGNIVFFDMLDVDHFS